MNKLNEDLIKEVEKYLKERIIEKLKKENNEITLSGDWEEGFHDTMRLAIKIVEDM